MSEAKPFKIPRQEVMNAYLKVKANKGAAGVDAVSMNQFDKNTKLNLYRIWNRMSSGSYMPPPVKLVEIEKKEGGVRPLGIPKLLSYYYCLQWFLGIKINKVQIL